MLCGGFLRKNGMSRTKNGISDFKNLHLAMLVWPGSVALILDLVTKILQGQKLSLNSGNTLT